MDETSETKGDWTTKLAVSSHGQFVRIAPFRALHDGLLLLTTYLRLRVGVAPLGRPPLVAASALPPPVPSPPSALYFFAAASLLLPRRPPIKGHITAYTQYKLKKRSLGDNVNSIS